MLNYVLLSSEFSNNYRTNIIERKFASLTRQRAMCYKYYVHKINSTENKILKIFIVYFMKKLQRFVELSS